MSALIWFGVIIRNAVADSATTAATSMYKVAMFRNVQSQKVPLSMSARGIVHGPPSVPVCYMPETREGEGKAAGGRSSRSAGALLLPCYPHLLGSDCNSAHVKPEVDVKTVEHEAHLHPARVEVRGTRRRNF